MTTKTCTYCFQPMHQGARNKMHAACRSLARQEMHRKVNAERRRKMITTSNAARPIVVTYPNVAEPDHWTRHEYEMYASELPADARVEMKG
jgi:hypothetical protein